MSAIAIVVWVAIAGLLVTLIVVIRQLVRLLETLQHTIIEMERAVARTNLELHRVDGVVSTAESISNTVDSASRLAYVALSNPVVKAISIGAGTARATRRLRRRR